ncbi:MAG: beta-lactamase family protein, partial [Bryobacterales bacterium]|nr:beta-lactamase family protein [Bryobacterales bacterium]
MRGCLLLILAALPTQAERRFDASPVDQVLQNAVGPRGVPGVVAMVATPDAVLYRAAYGEAKPGQQMAIDSVFRIFSMTKPVTTVAAMQLVERGKLALDAPVERYLPELTGLQILTGFGTDQQPVLAPAKRQPTLRQLLSHTAGFGYGIWDELLGKYPDAGFMKAP